MRDVLFAADEMNRLACEMSLVSAIYTINKVSQDFLIRPMGIFQLVDYVGVDVCQFIMKVMQTYLSPEVIHCEFLDKLLVFNIKGGQNADGSQKDGIFKYEKNKITAPDSVKKSIIFCQIA